MLSPSTTLTLRSRASIILAEKIGGGGEGTVHNVSGQPSVVAKVYHAALSGERVKKLEAMIGVSTPALSQITAWPADLLYAGAKPAGFIMPRATKAEEAHILYGLKSRKQKFPNAGFRFLVHAAMNVARAFATVHAHGIVIGDVNEKLAMIGHDAKVRLIDCDSFQLKVGNKQFLCDVGVPTFTPPELQTLQTLRGIQRTEQHDAFGLAVLIFHILFLGRHPFAGRYRLPDMPIEKAIQEHRFAYSADRTRTQMQQPPNTPALSYSGQSLATLFEQAFAPTAAKGQQKRPSAAQWTSSLEALLTRLVPCAQNAAHAYVPANGTCPWCAIELNSRIDLFNYVEPTGAATPSIDYEAIWKAINGIRPIHVRSSRDANQLKQGLAPSPEAQLINRSRAEQHKIAVTQTNVTAVTHHVDELIRRLKGFESDASKSRAHVANFDRDGTRLTQLQGQFKAGTGALKRNDLIQKLAAASVVPAAACFAFVLQNVYLIIMPILLAVGAGTTLYIRQNNSRRHMRKLTSEMHTLRASVDLGLEHRKQLAEEADRMVAKARAIVAQAKSQQDAAAAVERMARDGATVSQSAAEQDLRTLNRRYQATVEKINGLAHIAQSTESELNTGWRSIQERQNAAVAVYKDITALEFHRTAARKKAHAEAHEAQLNDYLDRYFIAQHSWSRIPKSALSALSSYGIETAADINRSDVLNVPGFGDVRTRMLLDWRSEKTKGFSFDPTKGDHSGHLQKEERRLNNERQQHEKSLARIKAQLDAVVSGVEQRARNYERDAQGAALQLAQLLVDSDALQLNWTAITIPTPVTNSVSLARAQPTATPIQPRPLYAPPATPKRAKKRRRRPSWKRP